MRVRNAKRRLSLDVPHVLLATLCACALASSMLCGSSIFKSIDTQDAYADNLTVQSASAISYDGDEVTFVKADLSTEFGMFRNPSGDMTVSYGNGSVHISFTPKNRSVYKGFYLNASIDDRATWNDSNFISAVGSASDSSLAYDFTIDASYCGNAWPIVPIIADGRSGAGGTSEAQYYMTVPPLEKIAGNIVTVTFTNGLGSVIGTSSVSSGQDATPPAEPKRDGYIFAGWDASYAGVTQDITVNAIWTVEPGVNAYTVTFTDGQGGVILSELVREGYDAVAPSAPAREGYTFSGWKPATFNNIMSDLTIEAQWLDNASISLEALRTSIAALPDDPRDLLRDTGNTAVANAVAAYLALDGDVRARLSESERLHLARCAIAVLPSDPFKVTSEHSTPITSARNLVASLTEDMRNTLDSEEVSSSRTYGRYLENADWALDSLSTVNNVTMLQAGTYTGQVTSTSSMGKSASSRAIGFTVTSITVKDGKAMAILQHGSNSSRTLKLGGVEYANLQTEPAGKSYYEIPISLNSTFHFSVKGKNATDETDAISYEMTVTADEDAMTPDKPGETAAASDTGSSTGSGSGSGSTTKSNSGSNLSTLVGSRDASSANTAAPNASSEQSASKLREVELGAPAIGGASIASTNIGPAVAGIAILFISAGALAFTLRFLRRESASPKFILQTERSAHSA